MTELDNAELMRLRGQESTLYFERRDLLKKISDLSDGVISMPGRLLKNAQAKTLRGTMDARDIASNLGTTARMLDGMLMRVAELDAQLAEIRPLAWPK